MMNLFDLTTFTENPREILMTDFDISSSQDFPILNHESVSVSVAVSCVFGVVEGHVPPGHSPPCT